MNQSQNEFQKEFIRLYNELHNLISSLSEPYFQDVADGVIKDDYVKQEKAQGFLTRNFIPFMSSVHVLKKNDLFIQKKMSDFYKINELRNLIVHEYNGNYNGDYKIVNIIQPTDYSLDLIKETIEKLNKSITIEEFLKLHNKAKVKSVNLDTNIYELFQMIKDTKFTQFPVFSNQDFKGLVSDNGVTLRLSEFALEEKAFETLDLSNLTVVDFIDLDEQRYSYEIIESDEYLYNILSKFEITSDTQILPILLIRSSNSKTNNLTPKSLIGILTSYDYLDIYKEAISKISF